jgi:DNA invertase Pin-like site-specific DNA recombinase
LAPAGTRPRHGSVVSVTTATRLGRLARSTRDLLNVLAANANKGAAFRSLNDAWADTTTLHGRLMVTVLGGLAEFERELIVARTSEERARAKARGVKLGPRFKLSAEQRAYVARERAKGESVRHLARILGVSKATIGRIPAAEP